MAQPFRSTPPGLIARLDPQERGLLRRLFEDVVTMLEGDHTTSEDPLEQLVGLSGDVEAPQDPALRRLLPEGSTDPERAEEFRRYTDRSLREEKVGALRRAAMAVEHDPVQLEGDGAVDFSRALNDVRLVLATRLHVESSDDARRIEELAASVDVNDVDDPETYMSVVYGFVSWLLNSLVEAMLLDLPGDHIKR
ncbi:DUF2017 domain-containing protein [Kocuria sp. JC486]|uniref:DUF2017 domain-containing protein n=1 Tax=Kocuria sp. JC486 TaxID=1970736 RepID=UPI00142450CA|nr:DUF2017 domain-containing protein [Kocuria sp. JC486]NHU84572.1 DUF2017 domain-containing protein [Kocuria sp. JC486]